MVYFVVFMIILAVVLGMFALAKGEGQNYSNNNLDPHSKGDDHFNSFTL